MHRHEMHGKWNIFMHADGGSADGGAFPGRAGKQQGCEAFGPDDRHVPRIGLTDFDTVDPLPREEKGTGENVSIQGRGSPRRETS